MADDELRALRQSIDEIDRRILRLISDRARLVLDVGAWKRERGAAVYDPERERAMTDALVALAEPPLEGPTVRRIFERIVDESRRLEQRAVRSQDLVNKDKE